MYKLIISPQAQKELKQIKKSYKSVASAALIEIKEDPFLGKSLGDELIGQFSFRIGVYRIIYKINQADKVINVISAGHRSIVYE